MDKAIVSGGVTREAIGSQYDAFLLAAHCQVLACKTVFEIGTYHGETACLNELAPELDRPIVHILGTRLAIYSRRADYLLNRV